MSFTEERVFFCVFYLDIDINFYHLSPFHKIVSRKHTSSCCVIFHAVMHFLSEFMGLKMVSNWNIVVCSCYFVFDTSELFLNESCY